MEINQIIKLENRKSLLVTGVIVVVNDCELNDLSPFNLKKDLKILPIRLPFLLPFCVYLHLLEWGI